MVVHRKVPSKFNGGAETRISGGCRQESRSATTTTTTTATISPTTLPTHLHVYLRHGSTVRCHCVQCTGKGLLQVTRNVHKRRYVYAKVCIRGGRCFPPLFLSLLLFIARPSVAPAPMCFHQLLLSAAG